MDDAATFSAIAQTEFQLLRNRIFSWFLEFKPKPSLPSKFEYWLYGSISYASFRRNSLGSDVLHAKPDNQNSIYIRHIVVKGAAQWIIVRTLIREGNVEYIQCSAICYPTLSPTDFIPMYDFNPHSQIRIDRFIDRKTKYHH